MLTVLFSRTSREAICEVEVTVIFQIPLILLVFVSNPFSYSQNENSYNNIMFYHMELLSVREKTSQNKGCDWLSVDSPLLKMCRSQNRIHSNVSACIMTCLFFRRKGGTSWLLHVQTRLFPRVLRLILPQTPTNHWHK